MTEEQQIELDRCISDPVYFAEKYCYIKSEDGSRKKLSYTEANKHMMDEFLIKGECSVFIKRRK